MRKLAISGEPRGIWHPSWKVCVGRTARSWVAQDLGGVESVQVADEETQPGVGWEG